MKGGKTDVLADSDESLNDAIERMLRAGTSNLDICRELGVDRAKVSAIKYLIYSDDDAE